MLSTCRDAILHASFIWSWHLAVLRQSSRRNGLCPVQGPMHGQDVYWCDGGHTESLERQDGEVRADNLADDVLGAGGLPVCQVDLPHA